MGEWKKVRIGKIFHLEKGCLQSSKCIQGKYDFITAAKDWKTHNTYTHDCEAIVYAVAASGSLGQAHYINGKFIASDLCLILTEKDKTKYPINFLFYQIIFESLRDEVVSKTKTGTSKEAISQKNFSAYEIPYFSIDFQNANYQRLINAKKIITEINKEIEAQKLYVKQLRRNILQDAIEGKLTADWRKEHPVQKGNPDYDAEALFELIQKERKGYKKWKKLPPILDAEKPFELPTEWKWVRLGEIAEGFMYGTSAKSSPFGTCPVLRMGNIQDGMIDWEKLVYSNNEEEISKYALRKFDLLFNRTNSREIVGKTAVYESDKQAIYAGYLVRFRIILSNLYFINYVLNSPMHREWCNAMKTDALGQSNINAEKLKKFVLALPPLAEQQKIVDIVSTGLDNIWELKKQISLREEYTNQLMKDILKDALEER
ncbi:restriction endonuclease subunit S [uncultured Treponema sp.]|uniref:restriction endonuclease subunit S n=1 Tax=uncultured Treponema sp. TaxID=162155 RepID=UPI0028EADC4A|nr:restriction endonuclease subunit S [uncultured Treponema sp.]